MTSSNFSDVVLLGSVPFSCQDGGTKGGAKQGHKRRKKEKPKEPEKEDVRSPRLRWRDHQQPLQ